MACGHCRRPRKEILAFNFDQLYWTRGLSISPKSQGGSKVVLRGSKIAPEIGSLESQNSPGRPEAHPGRALALPAPRKAPGSVRAAADCTPPPGTLVTTLHAPAPAPGPGETTFTYYFLPPSLYLLPSNMWFLVDPHAAALRGRRIRKGCALCRRPRKKNKNVAFEFELLSSET